MRNEQRVMTNESDQDDEDAPSTVLSRGSIGGLNPFHHLGRGYYPRLLDDDAAVLQDHEVWNALDVIPRGNFGMLLGIDFEHEGPAGHCCGHSFDFRSRRSTRPTPGRPEIHQDRERGLLNDLVEELLIGIDRFGQWCERDLARAAPRWPRHI